MKAFRAGGCAAMDVAIGVAMDAVMDMVCFNEVMQ